MTPHDSVVVHSKLDAVQDRTYRRTTGDPQSLDWSLDWGALMRYEIRVVTGDISNPIYAYLNTALERGEGAR